MVFHRLWLNLVAFPEPPQLLTTDGDPLVFCRSVFETDHAEAVRAELTAQPDIRATRDGQLSWRERRDDGDARAGVLVDRGQPDRLRVDLAGAGGPGPGLAGVAAGRAGPIPRDLARDARTDDERAAVRRAAAVTVRGRGPASRGCGCGSRALRPAVPCVARPPGSGPGATARHAPRRPARLWRAKVVDLLKQLENAAERASTTGRPAYDFRWLWQELGLARPGPVPSPPGSTRAIS